ncbi:25-like lysozyme [Janthinobacterium sp. KBS0711]|uniref:GPW/gp25 family protein n=1 Tax=Janthinobacterium sp. KBS0711 TaxID=1649647 RepID=UPI000627994F|nr:GPW/gp25 family protein [Janthinobacterium sp. KBS0711]KKO65363.1 25-like lysozyme [Janthinobacterium sp. KBS0711]TSD71198.1 oxidoreductase [Janthinobacterium sp. KBS0711]
MMGMHAATGRSLTGLGHLRQSVADILTTPIGSRIRRRRYGSEVPELIDQPLNSATQLRIYAATAFALRRWEPRLQLSSVQLTRDTDGAITLLLDGTANGQGITLSVPVKQGGIV